MSIRFHKKYFKKISHFLEFLWILMHEKAGRKYPNRLVDSCKRSSVNWMAAG